jgi:hypothetical protein
VSGSTAIGWGSGWLQRVRMTVHPLAPIPLAESKVGFMLGRRLFVRWCNGDGCRPWTDLAGESRGIAVPGRGSYGSTANCPSTVHIGKLFLAA